MNINKLTKSSLEDILCEMMKDLEKVNNQMYKKYEDIIDCELYYIDENEAVNIVKSMKPYGEVFSITDVVNMLNKNQIHENKYIKYYLCMNMFYNDYKIYAESKRLDIKEFCFEMSKLFIDDVDAVKYKVEKYFKNI